MNHAAKLAYQIDTSLLLSTVVTPHQKYGKVQRYGKGLPGDYVAQEKLGWGSETKNISNADLFREQLPSRLLSLEQPFVFILELPAVDVPDPVLPAHVDFNKTCGINVYLETNGEVTKFYHWNKEAKKAEYTEEFCAATGDVWLMDTSVPHSVTLTPRKARQMLTFSFTKLKYNEVLECFATK